MCDFCLFWAVKCKNWVRRNIAALSMGSVALLLLTIEKVVFWLWVCSFVPLICTLNYWAKNVWFLPILHRSGPVKRKNWVRQNIPVLSMGLVALLLLTIKNVVFWLWVSLFVSFAFLTSGPKCVIFALSMGLVALLLLTTEKVVFWFCVSSFVPFAL